ncbi:hypothetical protein KQX54_005589 [Cotesia glomerata]|uniref:Uncharacterized protein n=1 Tax=Cotesia glomerata TaxID=32391 RepID=A0AAV7ICS0_COTGL|nr:hypothetical protein KQX54_005589 [Cotesia glomerata]
MILDTVSEVASVMALLSLVRRACDRVRGQRTTPWAPPAPEPDAEAALKLAIGGGGVVAVDVDDLHHHHGN